MKIDPFFTKLQQNKHWGGVRKYKLSKTRLKLSEIQMQAITIPLIGFL